jgi:integrase
VSEPDPRASLPPTPVRHLVSTPISPYADDLAQAGLLADAAVQADTFADYHASCSQNTRAAQRNTLQLFSTYLEHVGVVRTPEDLSHDAEAWRGMSKGLLLSFRKWLLEQGYAIGTLNQRLAILRQYARLAHQAGAIADEPYELLMTVKGYGPKIGRNLDHERTRAGKRTRKSTKKATPTAVTSSQALLLKTQTTRPQRKRRSKHDQAICLRDQLLMGLFIEHAFRVSEVVALDIQHLDTASGTITLYREKTAEAQVHQLKKHTRQAAEAYLAQIQQQGRTSGPLFLGYQGKRITRYGLYDRVRLLGEQLGIDHLSPHDLRHYWTADALSHGTPIDQVQSGGNWKSPTMVLTYAKRRGIANEGVRITE